MEGVIDRVVVEAMELKELQAFYRKVGEDWPNALRPYHHKTGGSKLVAQLEEAGYWGPGEAAPTPTTKRIDKLQAEIEDPDTPARFISSLIQQRDLLIVNRKIEKKKNRSSDAMRTGSRDGVAQPRPLNMSKALLLALLCTPAVGGALTDLGDSTPRSLTTNPTVEDELTGVTAEMRKMREEMTSMHKKVGEMGEMRKEMDGLEKEVGGLQKKVGGLEEEVDGLEEELGEMGELRMKVDGLH